MGIRKSIDETVVVGGEPSAWFQPCERALTTQKFKKVTTDRTISQVRGSYKPLIGTLFGDIQITMIPEGPNTRLNIRATANADNIYALGRSPAGKLISMFKEGLAAQDVSLATLSAQAPNPGDSAVRSVSDEVTRLAELHSNKILTDEEYSAAKAKLLGLE
jgi:hypothetical protein